MLKLQAAMTGKQCSRAVCVAKAATICKSKHFYRTTPSKETAAGRQTKDATSTALLKSCRRKLGTRLWRAPTPASDTGDAERFTKW